MRHRDDVRDGKESHAAANDHGEDVQAQERLSEPETSQRREDDNQREHSDSKRVFGTLQTRQAIQ